MMRDGETEGEEFERREAEETALLNKISNVEVSGEILKIKIEGEEELRELEILDGKTVSLSGRTYFLISTQLSFKNKLTELNNSSTTDISLIRCIFLSDIFIGDIAINVSTDPENLLLADWLLRKSIFFYKSIFQGEFHIRSLIFKNQINFNSSVCIGKVRFFYAGFARDLFFSSTVFRGPVIFENNNFEGSFDLTKSHFLNDLIFKNSTIGAQLNLSQSVVMKDVFFSSRIDSLNLSRMRFDKENFRLYLEGSKINEIIYCESGEVYDESNEKISRNIIGLEKDILNIDIEKNIQSRETLSVLKKCFAATKNDIMALEFHKMEYEKHYRALNFRDNFQDKFLLFIEKYVSGFGTSVGISLSWFFVFNAFCFFAFSYFVHESISSSCAGNFINRINCFLKSTSPLGLGLFPLLVFIVNSFFLYEIVKSFRKFSRKF